MPGNPPDGPALGYAVEGPEGYPPGLLPEGPCGNPGPEGLPEG